MNVDDVINLVNQNLHLILISAFGGLVLFVMKVSEHFHKPIEEKLTRFQYIFWVLAIFFIFPILGGGMVAIYLANGDKIGAVLSFQVGLTSPAIVQGLVISAANQQLNRPMEIPDEA